MLRPKGCILFCGLISMATACDMGLPSGSYGKESACSVEDPGSIPGLGRSPGEGDGYPLHYSYLVNSMGRGA